MPKREECYAAGALELLLASSDWILARQQWLVSNMHSIVTGKSLSSLQHLYQFSHFNDADIRIPRVLIDRFKFIQTLLENVWESTIKTSQSISHLDSGERLNNYQQLVNNFLHSTSEVSQLLWHEFTMRDSLTGAWTRMTLSSSLLEEFQRTKRYGVPCSIALLDQNDFKHINDRWGHMMGDKVLVEMAETIQNCLRGNDKLFRYGGDEWLVLMPSTTKIEAQECMVRIQKIIANHQFKSETQELFSTSFAFGVAASEQYDNVEDWVASADKQLYQNKQWLSLID